MHNETLPLASLPSHHHLLRSRSAYRLHCGGLSRRSSNLSVHWRLSPFFSRHLITIGVHGEFSSVVKLRDLVHRLYEHNPILGNPGCLSHPQLRKHIFPIRNCNTGLLNPSFDPNWSLIVAIAVTRVQQLSITFALTHCLPLVVVWCRGRSLKTSEEPYPGSCHHRFDPRSRLTKSRKGFLLQRTILVWFEIKAAQSASQNHNSNNLRWSRSVETAKHHAKAVYS